MNTIKFGSLNPSMKYIVCKTKSDNHISIQIRVNAGSRDEKNNIHGISHLLEHMFFQGSIKYPTQKEMRKLFISLGNHPWFRDNLRSDNIEYWATFLKEDSYRGLSFIAHFHNH